MVGTAAQLTDVLRDRDARCPRPAGRARAEDGENRALESARVPNKNIPPGRLCACEPRLGVDSGGGHAGTYRSVAQTRIALYSEYRPYLHD